MRCAGLSGSGAGCWLLDSGNWPPTGSGALSRTSTPELEGGEGATFLACVPTPVMRSFFTATIDNQIQFITRLCLYQRSGSAKISKIPRFSVTAS